MEIEKPFSNCSYFNSKSLAHIFQETQICPISASCLRRVVSHMSCEMGATPLRLSIVKPLLVFPISERVLFPHGKAAVHHYSATNIQNDQQPGLSLSKNSSNQNPSTTGRLLSCTSPAKSAPRSVSLSEAVTCKNKVADSRGHLWRLPLTARSRSLRLTVRAFTVAPGEDSPPGPGAAEGPGASCGRSPRRGLPNGSSPSSLSSSSSSSSSYSPCSPLFPLLSCSLSFPLLPCTQRERLHWNPPAAAEEDEDADDDDSGG